MKRVRQPTRAIRQQEGFTPASQLPAGNWTPAFHDEFTIGTKPSARYWRHFTWGDNNNPQEDAAFRQGDVSPTTGHGGYWYDAPSVSTGTLKLTASDDDTRYGAADWPYRSAMVRTKESFLYGYVEVRAKMAAGQGLWTTLWMMPTFYDNNNAWEIDIAECPGTGATTVHQNIHWGVFEDGNQDISHVDGDYSTSFHNFGVNWQPSLITWYIDGVSIKTHSAHVPDVPMQVLCFLEVGGPDNWVGQFDGSTPLPRSTEVEYIRVYR